MNDANEPLWAFLVTLALVLVVAGTLWWMEG